MILRLIERFGNSMADALFWVLIIFAVTAALLWVTSFIVDYLLREPTVKLKEPKEE